MDALEHKASSGFMSPSGRHKIFTQFRVLDPYIDGLYQLLENISAGLTKPKKRNVFKIKTKKCKSTLRMLATIFQTAEDHLETSAVSTKTEFFNLYMIVMSEFEHKIRNIKTRFA